MELIFHKWNKFFQNFFSNLHFPYHIFMVTFSLLHIAQRFDCDNLHLYKHCEWSIHYVSFKVYGVALLCNFMSKSFDSKYIAFTASNISNCSTDITKNVPPNSTIVIGQWGQ